MKINAKLILGLMPRRAAINIMS